MRSSHFGSHQFQSPSSSIVAGTRTGMRTTVAVDDHRDREPEAHELERDAASGPSRKLPNTKTMISAAAVMTARE